ncbi:short chain dehydrogenase reductase [Echria macrotheca]|uniref:Short chain dehydrogenase reductase n=1 Tax=Echria macrotheca TaxID=438768 RepID=A0AAJ0BLI2_9PEZI|nr:short chain dehydrogenase reductase [Echria macrotheca]
MSAFPTPILPYHQAAYPAIDPTRPALSTAGKSILITGGGTGIGAETALSFAKSGASHLALVGRRPTTLQTTASKITALYPSTKVHVIPGDMTSLESITSALSTFAGAVPSGKIDVLVACAGYMDKVALFDDTDPADWWRTFEINVKGNYNLLRAFGAVGADDAVVLHVSTTIAHQAYVPRFSAYQSSKLAAIKVFDHWAREHPGRRVVHYHPGLIVTDIGVAADEAELGLQYDDISLPGAFAVWAASPEADFLNGRFVFAHWDVDTLKSKEVREELEADPQKFTIVLKGWPH